MSPTLTIVRGQASDEELAVTQPKKHRNEPL